MKKYPNINKYFNKTPKGFLLAALVFYIVSGSFSILTSLFASGFPFLMRITSIVVSVGIMFLLYTLYMNQVTLAKARLGKHLTKQYGLEGDALVAQIDAIDREMERPIYADATNKRKYNAFFITENWLVGTDGVMLLRANACKRADVKNVEKTVMTRTRKGITYYYYILKVTGKNDYVYEFWLRSQENVDMAYDYLMRLQEVV